ncbi:adenosylmethionine decarboxylase [Vagococcus fluvialis]|uniref:adenosylmethionine decarboxylase n=1 Tax=Vagococcus fluvialis TaxID=2738 RepID=UPI003B5A9785
MKTLEKIRNNLEIEESIEVLKKGLACLYLKKTISTKELAKLMEIPVPLATAFKKELVKVGWLKRESFYFLTELGRNFVLDNLHFSGIDKGLYMEIVSSEESLSDFLIEVSKELEPYMEKRPQVKRNLDQAHATKETVMKRVALLLKDPLIFSKKICFVGDDDLVSVFLSLVLKKLGSKNDNQITVLDIDQEILTFCAKNKWHGLSITTKYQDVRFINHQMNQEVDIIMTDPPYTTEGLLLFLKVADSYLKENGYIYLSFSHKSPHIQRFLQGELNGLGYHYVEIIPNFNTYMGGGIIGNVSNLYILQKTKLSRSLESTTSIYTQAFKKKESIKLGFHTLFEVKGCQEKSLRNVKQVKDKMKALVDMYHLKAVDETFHQFKPFGVSGVIVLKESHFTIHTWPEYGYAAVDLFICEDIVNEKQFANSLVSIFEAETCLYQKVYREN